MKFLCNGLFHVILEKFYQWVVESFICHSLTCFSCALSKRPFLDFPITLCFSLLKIVDTMIFYFCIFFPILVFWESRIAERTENLGSVILKNETIVTQTILGYGSLQEFGISSAAALCGLGSACMYNIKPTLSWNFHGHTPVTVVPYLAWMISTLTRATPAHKIRSTKSFK